MNSITKERLLELFEYRDGKIFFKFRSGSKSAGKEAGSIQPNGYKRVRIDRKSYAVHRIIFFMHYGFLPEFLDHINNDKLDNRFENLRPATISQNNHNIKIPKHNTSGVKGLTWNKNAKKWHAAIKLNGKKIYLGIFQDKELAELVICEARSKYHQGFANNG